MPETVTAQAAAAELLKRRQIRRSFAAWCRHRGFDPAAHHMLIINEIEAFLASTDLDVLLLFAPPGSAKSSYVSVLFPPWYLAGRPKNSILFATHSVEFAERWGRRVRNDIASEGPALGISLSDDNKAAARWSLAAGGEYYAVGAGTGISGYRADLGLIDDPFGSREDAYSETVRRSRWNWYLDDFSARLKPSAKRIVMACMTGDTPVAMADGSCKRLEGVRPGDMIVAWEGGEPVNRRVLNWAPQGEDDLLEIRTGSSRVRANARHPFLVVDKTGEAKWVRAGNLEKGDRLVTLAKLDRGTGYPVTNIYTRTARIQAPNSHAPVDCTISNVQWAPKLAGAPFVTKMIRSIKPAGREMVYDIEVEGAHSFVADGLVTHNTRWHEEDISGHVLDQIKNGQVRGKAISIAAIAEEDDVLGRKPGEYLWDDPTGYNYGAFLRSRQRETSPMMWSALYQQRPAPEEGDYFKAEWLVSCETLPDRATLRVYGASDYAVTADGGDYTVHVVIGLDPDNRMYLLDLWRKQSSSDEWIEAFCDLVLRWKPMAWAEEQGQIRAGIGPFLDRRQRERSAYVAREAFPTRGDKAVRAQSIRGRMALEKLYVPASAPWHAAFRAELLTFPAGKHDDQVDALGLVGQLLDVMVSGQAAKKTSNVVNIGYRRIERQVEGFKTY